MTTNVFDIFTHAEVLKSQEPDYFKNSGSIKLGEESDQEPCNLPGETHVKNMSVVKTYVTILDEGCKKHYDGSLPLYSSVECPDKAEVFVVRCELRDMVASARAKTKKAAKQLAAKEILLKVIDKENYVEFGLGKNKGTAVNYVTNLMPELSTAGEEREAVSSENWIGKINEKCQRLKLRAAIYDVEDRGSTTQHLFVATCSVCKLVTSGQSRTKKAAKMIAAEEMFKKLELSTELEKMENELEPENEDDKPVEIVKGGFDDEATSKQDRQLKAVLEQEQERQLKAVLEQEQERQLKPSLEQEQERQLKPSLEQEQERQLKPSLEQEQERQLKPSLEQEQVAEERSETCLSVDRFLAGSTEGLRNRLQLLLDHPASAVSEVFIKQQLQYTVLTEPNVDGDVQCLLKVLGTKGENSVFGGTGRTENAARDNAARSALFHLRVFLT